MLISYPVQHRRRIQDSSPLWMLFGIGVIAIAGLYETGTSQGLGAGAIGILSITAMAGAIFLLLVKKDKSYRIVFAAGFLVRAAIVLALVLFPPQYQRTSVRVPAIFPDEVYYSEQALRWSQYALEDIAPRNRFELVSAYQALIYRILGPDVMWVRFIHVLVGCVAALILYDCAAKTLNEQGRQTAVWLSVLYPASLVWSTVVLKESIFILAIALLLNAAVRLSRRELLVPILILTLGSTIIINLRPIALAFALIPVAAAMIAGRKDARMLPVALIGCALFVVSIGISAGDISSRLGDLSDVLTLDAATRLMATTAWDTNLHPAAQAMRGGNSVAQALAAPVVLAVTPPHTAMVSFLREIGTIRFWPAWVIGSMAAGWWLTVPFLVLGLVVSVRNGSTYWKALAIAFLCWYLIASYARGMSSMESVRNREQMIPFALLLVAAGSQWVQTRNGMVRRYWYRVLGIYFCILLASAVLYSWRWEILACCI
jgi:hypothetical protein